MFRRASLVVGILASVLSLSALGAQSATNPPAGRADSFEMVHAYPHDSKAFTQGLIFVDGHLYESTGLNGRSSIRMVDLASGTVLQKYDMPVEYFGEGLTDWGGSLIQLTWKAHKGFVYDRFSFSVLKTFPYEGEGWGLTHDGTRLIMSDGTAYLRFLDPKSWKRGAFTLLTRRAGRLRN